MRCRIPGTSRRFLAGVRRITNRSTLLQTDPSRQTHYHPRANSDPATCTGTGTSTGTSTSTGTGKSATPATCTRP